MQLQNRRQRMPAQTLHQFGLAQGLQEPDAAAVGIEALLRPDNGTARPRRSTRALSNPYRISINRILRIQMTLFGYVSWRWNTTGPSRGELSVDSTIADGGDEDPFFH
jgi:hypothetical protein